MAERPVAENVDDYISRFPPEVQERLKTVRATIRKAAPTAEEGISYAIPAYKLNGPLIYFAAHKMHIGIYPVHGTTREAFADELAGYGGGKGTVQFPHDSPLPIDLIGRIVRHRVRVQTEKSAKKRTPGVSA